MKYVKCGFELLSNVAIMLTLNHNIWLYDCVLNKTAILYNFQD